MKKKHSLNLVKDQITTTLFDPKWTTQVASQVAAQVSNDLDSWKKNKLRLNCKFVYLTYPTCPLKPREVLGFLLQVFNRQSVKQYLVVTEDHSDGTPHIHAWLHLNNICDIKDAKVLYIQTKVYNEDGTETLQVWKGNFQSMRKPIAVLQYVAKGINLRNIEKASQEERDALFVTNLDLNAFGWLSDVYEQAIGLAEIGKAQEALNVIKENSAHDYLANGAKYKPVLQGLAFEANRNKELKNLDKSDYIYPKAILDWLETSSDKYTLYVYGKPNIGKTRALFALLQPYNPVLVRHGEDLKGVDWEQHRAVVFDDYPIKSRTLEQKLNFLDLNIQGSLRVLFGICHLPAKVIRVFTSNNSFAETMFKPAQHEGEYTLENKGALLRRAYVVKMEVSFIKNPAKLYPMLQPMVVTETGEAPDRSMDDIIQGNTLVSLQSTPKVNPFMCKDFNVNFFEEKASIEIGPTSNTEVQQLAHTVEVKDNGAPVEVEGVQTEVAPEPSKAPEVQGESTEVQEKGAEYLLSPQQEQSTRPVDQGVGESSIESQDKGNTVEPTQDIQVIKEAQVSQKEVGGRKRGRPKKNL